MHKVHMSQNSKIIFYSSQSISFPGKKNHSPFLRFVWPWLFFLQQTPLLYTTVIKTERAKAPKTYQKSPQTLKISNLWWFNSTYIFLRAEYIHTLDDLPVRTTIQMQEQRGKESDKGISISIFHLIHWKLASLYLFLKMAWERGDNSKILPQHVQEISNSVDSGHARLHELGYKQELKRDLS